jgi:hypothetical protein
MAYDPARAETVLFGGDGAVSRLSDTWTWNGRDWTRHAPSHVPNRRSDLVMSSRNHVVLFGGLRGRSIPLNDTWRWDGSDWTELKPAHPPSARGGAGMAYAAADGLVVLFGGYGYYNLADTSTWDGVAWTQQLAGSIGLTSASGPPGRLVAVVGWGFAAGEEVEITFVDSVNGKTVIGTETADESGGFYEVLSIPSDATPGKQLVKAKGTTSGHVARHRFHRDLGITSLIPRSPSVLTDLAGRPSPFELADHRRGRTKWPRSRAFSWPAINRGQTADAVRTPGAGDVDADGQPGIPGH